MTAAAATLARGMYRMAPIAPEPPRAPPPGGVYRIPNLHAERAPPAPIGPVAERIAAVARRAPEELGTLESRQASLLAKLEGLRARMTSMLESLRTARPPERARSAPKADVQIGLPRDAVINVSPDFVPHSLLALKRTLNMRIVCHVHSSVESLNPAAAEFSRRLMEAERPNPELVLTLIWKDVGASTELIFSSAPAVIRGEVNVLRYAVAAAPCGLSYKDGPTSSEIDSALDLCHRLQSHKTADDRRSLLKLMAKKFGKNLSRPVSIADLAAWSVLKQLKDGPALEEFEKLMQKCEEFSCPGGR